MIVMAIVFRKVDLQARERKRGESARGRNMKNIKVYRVSRRKMVPCEVKILPTQGSVGIE